METIIIIKTDNEFILDRLAKAGFTILNNKVTVTEAQIDLFIETMREINLELDRIVMEMEEQKKLEEEELENVDELDSSEEEKEEVVKPGESEVDIYEKYVKDANGQDVIVQMSIIKQNKEDSRYERLVNISYLSSDGVLTSKEVFGYEDGYNFDNNALPPIIDGFHKDASLSGRKVEVSEVNPGKCYVTAGYGNSIYLDGYDVEYVQSIVAADKEHNLVGSAEDTLDLSELVKNDVIEETNMIGEGTFEEEVVGESLYDDLPAEEYQNSQELEYGNKKMVKKLGPDPRTQPNNYGLVNYLGLSFFFIVDIVAIVLGIYLLIK